MFQKWILGCVSLLSLAGCESAMDQKQKADEAREEARVRTDKAHSELDAEVRQAREVEARKIADAQAELSKIRADYRHRMEKNLIELDSDVAEFGERTQTKTGRVKADGDALLTDVKAKREQLQLSLNEIDRVPAENWDAARAALDKQWDDLKKLVSSRS